MLASLSPRRRRVIISALTMLLVIVVVVTVLAIRGSRSEDSASAATDQRPGPVLLIPGYGGSTSSLSALAARLDAEGKQTSVVSLPDGGVGDLNAQAGVVDTAAKALLARTGAKSLDIVGYSAGGVVARLFVQSHGGASLTRRVVTLGSPFHGTDLANLGSLFSAVCPTACQQLTSASSLLAGLNATPVSELGPSFVSIYTTADDVVLPPTSAVEDGARNIAVQSVCAGSRVNHTGLPGDRLVQSMVLAELGAGPSVGFAPSQCAALSG
jgi:pimeloyl-ACP methyl ester carboxylesterase